MALVLVTQSKMVTLTGVVLLPQPQCTLQSLQIWMLAGCFARIRHGEGYFSESIKTSCPALVVDQDVQVIDPVSSQCQSSAIKTVLAYELLTVVEEVEFWFISKIP